MLHPAPLSGLRSEPTAGQRVVVVVQEDASVRRLLEKLLRVHGFGVRTVQNASEAIQVILAERPAAAIVELKLASGPGLNVALSMPLPMPVILLAPSTSLSLRELERLRPRTRFMPRPYSLVMVLETLQQMLRDVERVAPGGAYRDWTSTPQYPNGRRGTGLPAPVSSVG